MAIPKQQALVQTRERVDAAWRWFAARGFDERQNPSPVRVSVTPHGVGAAYDANLDLVTVRRAPVGMAGGAHGYMTQPTVIDHEYGHRVIWHTRPDLRLTSTPESLALEEHIADIFAAARNRTWTIGAGSDGYLRDLTSGRGVDRDYRRLPRHMRAWIYSGERDLGSHLNVGIPNTAARRFGEQLGFDRLGELYAEALRSHPGREWSLRSWARETERVAHARFGSEAAEQVAAGWRSVGLDAPGASRALGGLVTPRGAGAAAVAVAALGAGALAGVEAVG